MDDRLKVQLSLCLALPSPSPCHCRLTLTHLCTLLFKYTVSYLSLELASQLPRRLLHMSLVAFTRFSRSFQPQRPLAAPAPLFDSAVRIRMHRFAFLVGYRENDRQLCRAHQREPQSDSVNSTGRVSASCTRWSVRTGAAGCARAWRR